MVVVRLMIRNVTLCIALPLLACSGASQADRTHDSVAPEITEWMPEPAILVFSRTLGWRHNEGIAGADLFFVQLARERQHGIFTTANAAVFNHKTLSRFELVVFNNVTGDSLSPDQQSAFEDWLINGGAWMGLHGSGDASQDSWQWYQESLIGPRFIGHPAEPQFQEARIETLDTKHPITKGVALNWVHEDEWYSFDSPAQDHGATVLFGLDENSYRPRNDAYGEVSDLRMGAGAINHPIVWVRCVGKGRAFYSAIGHSDQSYQDPNYALLLSNAFDWATKREAGFETDC
ncbi:MAG: ThuA domain-containing protein [Erythrobacter sp.]|uniref:ThuA domain-containing protein n=1 Tax=Erythrobacter sp. TaxID=1042 RepID=UPI003299074D